MVHGNGYCIGRGLVQGSSFFVVYGPEKLPSRIILIFFFFLNNFGFSVDFSCFWLCGYVMEFLLQLTEDWGEELFSALSKAGGKAFSNMAVGYNNVDVDAANKYGVAFLN